jgi:hypothetical protein
VRVQVGILEALLLKPGAQAVEDRRHRVALELSA